MPASRGTDVHALMAPAGLSPQETAAVEVAERVLGVTAVPGPSGIVLVHADGRRAAFAEATVGEQRDHQLPHLRRESDVRWPAPARWWWHVIVYDVRCLPRVREVFPVAARMCEAHNAPTPGLLPMPVTAAVPDLHWLRHAAPARLVGHPEVLDRPATVALAPCPAAGDLATVVPALEEWLATDRAAFAVARLAARSADERHLYLTVDYTGLVPDAFDALARADGVPAQSLRHRQDISHLWLAPVFGPAVFLWSWREGWSRHEPFGG